MIGYVMATLVSYSLIRRCDSQNLPSRETVAFRRWQFNPPKVKDYEVAGYGLQGPCKLLQSPYTGFVCELLRAHSSDGRRAMQAKLMDAHRSGSECRQVTPRSGERRQREAPLNLYLEHFRNDQNGFQVEVRS